MSQQGTQNKAPAQSRGPGSGHGPGGMGRPVEKAKNFKGTFRRLLGYLKPHRVNLVLVIILAVLSTAFTIGAPKIQAKAMNKMQDAFMAKFLVQQMSDVQHLIVDKVNLQMEQAKQAQIAAMKAQAEAKAKAAAAKPATGTDVAAGGTDAAKPAAGTDAASPAAGTDTAAGTGTDATAAPAAAGTLPGGAKMPDAATMALLKDFMALPMLDETTDANQRADIVQKILDLSKSMPAGMQVEFSDTAKATDGTAPTEPKEAGFLSGVKNTYNNLHDWFFGSDLKNADTKITMTEEQMGNAVQAIRDTNGKVDMSYIFYIFAILLAFYLVSSVFSLAMGLVMSGVSQKTVYQLRKEVDDKLTRLPLKYYDGRTHGEILSRMTNDVDTISTTLQQSLTQIVTSVVSILGYIIMMLTISPLLTVLVLLTLPLYILTTMTIAKKSQKFFAEQQKVLGKLSGHVEEMYTGHKVVKAFGKEADSLREFEESNEKLYNVGWKAQFISGIMWPLMNLISNLGYVLICVVGGLWITKGRLKIGDITAFINYSRSFTQPIIQTANIANIIQSTVACAERVFEMLDEQEQVAEAEKAVAIANPKGEVSFRDVDFSYVEETKLIEKMNLEVRQGHTVAIVGPTGAGKTTLVNLLMRFYELNAGSISVDGVDIRNMKRADLRGMFGMVLQDTWLFNGTIRDNIAYGREGASDADIVAAAKAAHADHFIRTLPEGYNTILNEEATNISQGQKQLLTIARAILADPAILILDEATSSVDTRTEVLIQKAMNNLMEGRTSFVIAHRLSTIRDAELILVMNNGTIIEQGNHQELLAKGGFYADLYNSQFSDAVA